GDEVSVTIVNKMEIQSTIHWHGIQMKGSIWSDGVPGVTQRQIDPGVTFIANWTANEPGIYWYHSHSRAIYGDGLRGAIYIRPNQEELDNGPFKVIAEALQPDSSGSDGPNVEDEVKAMQDAHMDAQVMSLVDWTHWDSETGLKIWNETNTELLCIDSILVNGKGRVVCPPPETFSPYVIPKIIPEYTAKGCALPNNTVLQPFPGAKPDLIPKDIFFTCKNTTSPIEVIPVDASKKWVSLAFVNIGTLWDVRVSIDSHKMWIYAADGQYHQPQLVDVVNIPPGERYQALVPLDQPSGDYQIRIAANVLPQKISGFAVLSYVPTENSCKTVPPATAKLGLGYGADVLPGFKELNVSTLAAYPSSLIPPREANVTVTMIVKRLSSLTWSLNKDPYLPFMELDEPLIFDPKSAQKIDQNLVPSYPQNSVVDAVIITEPGNPAHPMHKHGVKAFIIGQGPGNWTWNSVAEAQQAHPEYFNLENPPLRDGFRTPDSILDGNWIVIRYQPVEQAVTFFHCHINVHLMGGMALALLEGMDKPLPNIPQYYLDFDKEAAKRQGSTSTAEKTVQTPSLSSAALDLPVPWILAALAGAFSIFVRA
ncbi:hypothetical protein FRB90_011134, partial [Tulasnella sp. 427]